MFCQLSRRKAQSALEYSVLLAIIVGAIVVMQIYIKRGVQGRFREATDDVGEQFDPGHQVYSYETKSTSTIHETTNTTGVTTQKTEDMNGTETPQQTLRWGQTTTNPLNETEWGVPAR